MFEGHDPYLVALSVVIAILGGYTGFGLAARIRGTPGVSRRVLLASAAGVLAIGIWTMHFVGMLAAPIPADTVYLVLPTVISFLICALVVGISLSFVSIGDASQRRVISAAVLLGAGIASMHYVGIHGLAGQFTMVHDPAMVVLSVMVAILAAYSGLRAFLARQDGIRLIASSVAFGIAVSGMHYTAMHGMHFVACSAPAAEHLGALAASQQSLSLVVAVLCFVIAAGFLLSLVPDPRRQIPAVAMVERSADPVPVTVVSAPVSDPVAATDAATFPRPMSAPLGGLGQPPRGTPTRRLPVEGADGIHFIETTEIRSVRADAHYSRVHDGIRERLCPWSISEAEAQLDPSLFVRVHRSHIVAIPHVSFVRKQGDGAVIGLDGPSPHRVPVSRAKISELKARLGILRRPA